MKGIVKKLGEVVIGKRNRFVGSFTSQFKIPVQGIQNRALLALQD